MYCKTKYNNLYYLLVCTLLKIENSFGYVNLIKLLKTHFNLDFNLIKLFDALNNARNKSKPMTTAAGTKPIGPTLEFKGREKSSPKK